MDEQEPMNLNASLDKLIAEREILDQRIKELQSEAKKVAIAEVLNLIDRHTLKEQELFTSSSSSKTKKTSVTKVPAKYRNKETGKEWSGRGVIPIWLRGKDKNDFLIL